MTPKESDKLIDDIATVVYASKRTVAVWTRGGSAKQSVKNRGKPWSVSLPPLPDEADRRGVEADGGGYGFGRLNRLQQSNRHEWQVPWLAFFVGDNAAASRPMSLSLTRLERQISECQFQA